MLRKRQVITMVSIAVTSFLIGTMFNITTRATESGGNPWEKVWEAIYGLQAQVQSIDKTIQSLNETIEALKTETPKKPEIITIVNETRYRLNTENWYDLVSVSNVTISEGSNILAIATTTFNIDGAAVDTGAYLNLCMRANNSISSPTFTNYWDRWEGIYEIVEIHHTWINLTAGTYSFAVQYNLWFHGSGTPFVVNTRLTLIIL